MSSLSPKWMLSCWVRNLEQFWTYDGRAARPSPCPGPHGGCSFSWGADAGAQILKESRDAESTEPDLKDPFERVLKPLPDCGLGKRRNGFDEATSKIQQVRSGKPQGRPLFEGTGATSVALDYIQSFPQLPGDTVFIFRGTSICWLWGGEHSGVAISSHLFR